jgi:hypothetical protein
LLPQANAQRSVAPEKEILFFRPNRAEDAGE